MKLVRSILIASVLAATAGTPAWARFEPITCKNSFSPEQEMTEGNKVAAQVYQQMPVLPENDPVTRYVQQLGARLAANAPPTPGMNQRWPFTFHVVASGDINAFALPGGSIFVNLGTVQAAETEAQLAGVMAHEISHVVMRHSTCNMGKQQKYGLAAALGQIGSQILLGNGALGSAVTQGIGMGAGLGFLRMSRDDEKQADLLGTNILYGAGYDPRGLPQFFEVIQAKYGAGGAQLLSDHPNPGNRTEYVNAEIQTLPQRSNPIVTTTQFRQVHTQALAERALTAKEVHAGGWKGSGQYASGPGSNGAVMRTSGTPGAGAQANTPSGLSRASLGIDAPLQPLQTDLFTVRYPGQWQRHDSNGAVTLYPQGGAGDAGIVYGALIGTVRDAGTVSDAASLSQATSQLVQKLVSQNDGLSQVSRFTSFTSGGTNGIAVDLRGRSPISQGGSAVPERDWLVTFARPDGTMNYLVFVAPEQEFATLKPTFNAILRSFRPR